MENISSITEKRSPYGRHSIRWILLHIPLLMGVAFSISRSYHFAYSRCAASYRLNVTLQILYCLQLPICTCLATLMRYVEQLKFTFALHINRHAGWIGTFCVIGPIIMSSLFFLTLLISILFVGFSTLYCEKVPIESDCEQITVRTMGILLCNKDYISNFSLYSLDSIMITVIVVITLLIRFATAFLRYDVENCLLERHGSHSSCCGVGVNKAWTRFLWKLIV